MDTITAHSTPVPGPGRITVEFDGTNVTIKRGMLGSKLTTIPVARITSVGWKKSLGSNGHIEFIAAGVDGKVKFNAWQAKQFEALRDAVQAAL